MENNKDNDTTIYKIICQKCNKILFSRFLNYTCINCDQTIDNDITLIESIISKVLPRCLVITESFGELDPLTYSNTDLLHIGISNSKGVVYNFWNEYKKDKDDVKMWKKVINITLDHLTLNDVEFDKCLDEDIKIQKKKYPKYEQLGNNCYSYICRFLNSIKYANIEWTKEKLAITIIENKIMFFDKYCSIFKKLYYDNSIVVEDVGSSNYTYSCCDGCNEMIIEGQRNRCMTCHDFDLCDNCFNQVGHEHTMAKV